MEVLESIRSDVPNFVKDVPMVPKCIPRWGSTPNHFLMGSKMKLWTIHVQMGVLEVIRSDVPNFVKDVPRVPKCVPRWGSTSNHFLMGSKTKSTPNHFPEAIGSHVPNLMKDVQNFVKNVPNFVKDVPRVPKCVSRWVLTLNSFLMGF